MRLAQIALVLLPACGCAYYLLCIWGARRFLLRPTPAAGFTPTISILKPLKGVDPGIYASLRSHCLQDYPEFEIIFGVSDANDPVVASVEKLKLEFPGIAIHLVICPEELGGNRKISSLVQMLPHARYEHLLVNDSDIRVEPDYLLRVVAPLRDRQVGLVTCLYRGIEGGTIPSKLEALGLSTDFTGGVLAAMQITGGLDFGMGSTLMFRRADLQLAGGFEALVDYLADDYKLAQRLTQNGLRVHLSEVVVETFLPPYSWRTFFDHQVRWSRNIRNLRGWSYLGSGVTFGVPWALLGLVIARGASWAWMVLALTFALRVLMAWVVGVRVVNDGQIQRLFWLIPLRDTTGLFVWVAGYLGSTVLWRGERFQLRRGKLTRLPARYRRPE